MGNYTTNLGLYNTDMTTDGNDTFDFQRDLNDNNNIIDSAVGKLSNLTTTQKGSLVGAINEIDSELDGKASKDLDNLSVTGQAIIDGKVSSADLYDANQLIKLNKLQTYSLPSKIYDDLTLGTSGTTYTAPADGWVQCSIKVNSGYVILLKYKGDSWSGDNDTLYRVGEDTPISTWVDLFLPVFAGEKFSVHYGNYISTLMFRFIYANGAQQS